MQTKTTYFVPQSGIFSKIIGQSLNIESLTQIYMDEYKNLENISMIEKTSLMYLHKIIEKSFIDKIDKITFEKETIPLEKTLVVVMGNKNNLYGVILKPETISFKDSKTLSSYRFSTNINYISMEQFSSIFSS